MGLGIASVKLNLELFQRGLFKSIESAIDIGAQELHLKLKDFEELVKAAGITNYQKENFQNLENWPKRPRCQTRPFYEMLGIKKYCCVDLGGLYEAIPHDLNLPFEDKTHWGKYDLVTDYGCNEHVFNVAEAYRTMHRLCKPSGLMIISQQVTGGNGYFLFDLSFFEGIAAANNYKILFSSYIVELNKNTKNGSHLSYCIPLSRELLDVLDYSKVDFIGISYVMQKQNNEDFMFPYQSSYLAKSRGNIGYRLQYDMMPPSRAYIPIGGQSPVGIKYLIKELIKSIKRRFKLYVALKRIRLN